MAARDFAGLAGRRFQKRMNTLGVVDGMASSDELVKTFRNKDLDKLDAYYEGRQYAHLMPWDQSEHADGTYVKVRDRKPRLQYNFAKVLASRLAGKLCGKKNFPEIKIEEDPDGEHYFNLIKKGAFLRVELMEPLRRAINTGSCFVRFSIVGGVWKISYYLSKWCFPEFAKSGELEKIRIQYVFEDKEDLDEKRKPKKKWYKLELGKQVDVLYDNPIFKSSSEPEFKVEERIVHNLEFIQGEWITFNKNANAIDGEPILKDIMGFIDELNYSLSQTSSAVQYNQDPQLVLSNMDEDEVENLIRSSYKAWALGREGTANFLEAGMNGVETAINFRDKIKLSMQDVARIIMMDPEKMAAHAQSGIALEILNGPFVDLVEELQPTFEKVLSSLLLKMAMANYAMNEQGGIAPIELLPGFTLKSLNLVFTFPPVFPQTMQDLNTKVQIAVNVANASLISRESMLKWIAKEFDIENIEEEVARVDAQPVINPFGAF